jgi:hypothetical protein
MLFFFALSCVIIESSVDLRSLFCRGCHEVLQVQKVPHGIPEFGNDLLHSIRREELQDFLERKALDFSSRVVSHLRWFLNGIFNLALSNALIQGNPAAELRIPRKCQAGRAMRSLTEEEVNKYLEVFDLRERLIARLAIFEGMRPGEILALRWRVGRRRDDPSGGARLQTGAEYAEERQDPRRRDLRRRD